MSDHDQWFMAEIAWAVGVVVVIAIVVLVAGVWLIVKGGV